MAGRDIRLELTAVDKTRKAFSRVQKGLTNIAKAAGRVTKRVVQFGAAMGIAAVGGMVALTKASMTSIDSLAKVADKLGTTTDQLSALQHAAELSGIAIETFNMATQRLTRRVSEASSNMGESVAALKELGLNAQHLNSIDLDKKMGLIADSLMRVKNPTDRVRLAFKLFDSEGVVMLNLMKQGSAGMRRMAEEAETLGIVINRFDASKIEQANESWIASKSVLTGLGNELAIKFAPLIKIVGDRFRQAALDSGGFGLIAEKALQKVIGTIGLFADAALVIRIAWLEVQLTFTRAINVMKTAWNEFVDILPTGEQLWSLLQAMPGPIGLAARAWNDFGDTFKKWGKTAVDNVDKVGHVLRGIPGPIGATLTAVDLLSDKFNELDVPTEETRQLEAALVSLKAKLSTAPPSDDWRAYFEEIKALMEQFGQETAAITNATTSNEKKSFVERMGMNQARIKGMQELAEFEQKTEHEKAAHVIGAMSTLFAKNKKLQIANAIMQTYAGATKALSAYKPPLSFAMASAVIASGMQQVSAIKAQSFEGGGFTGHGARSGGVDGRGGMAGPFILHPNESIVDHSRGGGSIVINNQVDATGANAATEMRIREAMEQTSAATIVRIQDLMRRRRFA